MLTNLTFHIECKRERKSEREEEKEGVREEEREEEREEGREREIKERTEGGGVRDDTVQAIYCNRMFPTLRNKTVYL